MHDQVVPGSRVKVRFAGQDVDGFVLERADRSEHEGRLMPLRRAVSAEPVLSPAVARLSEVAFLPTRRVVGEDCLNPRDG